MSTFADKNIRLFATKSEEDATRLRRKRSSGRLKSVASNTDARAWSCNEDERRRHILQLLRSYDPNAGNFIPLDILFSVLFHLTDKEKSAMLDDAMDGLSKIDDIIRENDDLDKKLTAAQRRQRELEAQKKELSSLATCLSRAGGDLRKENACLKGEVDRLRKRLANLEKTAKMCEEERAELEKDLDKWLPPEEKERRRKLKEQLAKERAAREGKGGKGGGKGGEGGEDGEDGGEGGEDGEGGGGKDGKGGKGGKGASAKEVALKMKNMKSERDHLRNELDNLRNVQQQLRMSEQRITELLCEVEGLQKCLEKAECDAIQMVQIIEAQQEKICSLQMCECKLKDISAQRDLLKKQLQCAALKENNSMNSFGMESPGLVQEIENNGCDQGMNGDLASLECEKREVEMERDKLRCQLQMIEEELQEKDKSISRLNKKLCKQNECINSLKEMLSSPEKDPSRPNMVQCDNSSSDIYCKDLEEMQCKMRELQNKVGQQGQIIMSQRKCLLEQHKYILEQEQVRSNIQNRIREQARKQAELIYERNLLRNEIVFLTARLKTYLGKIQLLEKSIEQLFDTTKSSKCDEGFLNNMPSFSRTDSRRGMSTPHSSVSAAPMMSRSMFECGGGSSGKGKRSSCGPCGSNRNSHVSDPVVERYKNFRDLQNQYPSNRSGCPDIPETLSNDSFGPFMMPAPSSQDMFCQPPCDNKNNNRNIFMGGRMGADSMSSMPYSMDNCNEDMFNNHLQTPSYDEQFGPPMNTRQQMSPYGNNYRSRNLPERDQGFSKGRCKPCS